VPRIWIEFAPEANAVTAVAVARWCIRTTRERSMQCSGVKPDGSNATEMRRMGPGCCEASIGGRRLMSRNSRTAAARAG